MYKDHFQTKIKERGRSKTQILKWTSLRDSPLMHGWMYSSPLLLEYPELASPPSPWLTGLPAILTLHLAYYHSVRKRTLLLQNVDWNHLQLFTILSRFELTKISAQINSVYFVKELERNKKNSQLKNKLCSGVKMFI